MAHVEKHEDMPDNRHLHKRRQGWYVRIAVPPSLVPKVGKRHILKSLKTRDVAEARRRRWTVVAEIKAELDEAAGYGRADPVALGIKDRVRWLAASTEPEDAEDPTSHSERQMLELFYQDTAEEIEETQGLKAAQTYYRIATSNSPVLQEVAAQWLEEIRGKVKEQTRGHHRSAIALFRQANPRVVQVAQVDRRVAGNFVSQVLLTSDKAPRTRNRIISSLSSLWKWLVTRGLAESNPWQGQGDYSKRGSSSKRPFTKDELLTLLQGDPVALMGKRYGSAIRDLMPLSLMTGARLGELCQLTAGDVHQKERAISINADESSDSGRGSKSVKTKSATRLIPVHGAVWSIIEARLRAAEGGRLFPELEPGGPDEKLSWYVSKRFTEYRRRRKVGKGREVDFHSLRRCFATYLDRAQSLSRAVHPSVISELMGHTKETFSLSRYSIGQILAGRRKVINVLPRAMEPEVLAAVQGWPT